MVKKSKSSKHIDTDQKKTPESSPKKENISNAFLGELSDAFAAFDKLPDHDELTRQEMYGSKEYLEQFWKYFEKEHPSLLDKIEKKDLPIYIEAFKDRWFWLPRILDDKETTKLHNAFKAEDTEEHVVMKSLEWLKKFCEDDINNLPATAFGQFATLVWFDVHSFKVDPDGKIKNSDNLAALWKKFLEKEHISLGKTAAEQAEHILSPNYNPTERIMVTVAINKIEAILPWALKIAFKKQFSTPVSMLSSYQDLLTFKQEWLQFTKDHESEIDEKLAKKLDDIMVTNGDIQKELFATGRNFDASKWFSEQEQYFRRVFNKLVTRQLFEEVQENQETIATYVTAIGDTFKKFPSYVDDIFKIYPFNSKDIALVDPAFSSDFLHLEQEIVACNEQFTTSSSEEEKKELRKKMKALKQQKEQRRWDAYIAFLRSKNAALADVFAQLVASNFDFSVLSPDQQQTLVSALIEDQIKDTIKNKVPELLSLSEKDLTQFVHDLFDLKKMDMIVPTKYGPLPLKFTKKWFLSGARTTLPSLDDFGRDMIKLPLNFEVQLSDGNVDFFEKNPVFTSLYTPFTAKNWPVRINEGYKVQLTKNGQSVSWYLSSYCPIDEKYNDKNYDGKELFLYSEPITAPSDTRTLLTWPAKEGENPLPIVIKDNEQALCDVEILDKKINLNGDWFGALLFGYVIEQQKMNTKMSSKQEHALAEKFGDIEVYKDKAENDEESLEDTPVLKPNEHKETSEYQKLLTEWKHLKWYNFPENEKNWWFVEGTKMYVSYGDSELYPKLEGKAWMYLEITKIDETEWTFTVKIHGGELSLWGSEWATKKLPLSPDAFKNIKDTFGDIYKMPNSTWLSMDDHIQKIQSWWLAKDLEKNHLSWVKRASWNFEFTAGDFAGEKVTHFGRYEAGVWEKYDEEVAARYCLYKVKHNANHTITLTGEFMDKDERGGDVKKTYAHTMDYATFLLFIKEKGLQPKCEKQTKQMTSKQTVADQETPTTRRGYSIGNIISFFTNWASKIKDSMKKYDDERTEELTDILMKNGQVWNSLGWFLSPFGRISASFEQMGMDAFLERDGRIWKKVEKWKKFYEDGDFSLIYNTYLKPMLDGQIVIKPHYKAAAMLLAMIAKWKWPYNRNPQLAAKGMRINVLLWPAHQQRYLAMREKLIKEMEQWSAVYPSMWTDAKKNDILELEMKYIVHVMDARQLWIGGDAGDKEKYYFYEKYSQNFINELDKWYGEFFKMPVEVKKDASFDFARAEYFRLLGDRPQQAVPFLKTMATKAMNPSQWKVFEMAVMVGMLSGIFLTMTMSDTQWVIKDICRTRWFVPGIWVKDINQQYKLQRMLDLFSNGGFSKAKFVGKDDKSRTYSADKFSYRDISWGTKDCISGFETWMLKDNNLNNVSKFFELTGKDKSGKKSLLDMYEDKDGHTSPSDKALIKEFLDNSNEKDESLDSEVSKNPTAFTWSILTRSQSAVQQMMKIDSNGFVGDADQKQTMQWFFNDMKNSVPREKKNPEQVKIFMNKFFNWFEEKWFSGTNKTEFIKRLKYCQQHPNNPEVADILYYSIVGQICSSFRNVYFPEEFRNALDSWVAFFKENLNDILSPDVLESSFGGASYVEDYKREQPKFESWDTASLLLDKFDSNMYISLMSTKEEKDAARLQKRELWRPNGSYINGSLYKLAEDLERNNIMSNRFKNAKGKKKPNDKENLPMSSRKVTGAKIKNKEVVDDLQQILEGKQTTPTSPSDDISFMQDEEYYNDYNY